MDSINFHIAYLLTGHQQVIIPDFGAFSTIRVQDDKLNRRGTISPPVKYSLIFNPEIIKDDGLLVHSIAKEKNISDEEALQLVYKYVDKLVEDLRAGKIAHFPWVGNIHLSDGRKVVFTPAFNLSCNASGCGLANLNFPRLEDPESDSAAKRRKNRERAVVCLLILIVLLSIAGILMTFKPSPFFKDVMAFLNLSPITDIFTVNPRKPAAQAPAFVAVDSVASTAVDSIPAQPRYFIIIASFADKKEAEEVLDYLISKGMDNATLIRSDGKYRIAIKSFTNKEDAVFFLSLLRKEQSSPLFEDVWIWEDTGQ